MCMIVVVLDEHSQNFLQDQGRDQEDYQNWLFNDYSMNIQCVIEKIRGKRNSLHIIF